MKNKLFDLISKKCRGVASDSKQLSKYTSIRIGGLVECWFEPEDLGSLCDAIKIARSIDKRIFVIGAGSNLLIAGDKFEGLVIHLSSKYFKNIQLTNDVVQVGSAVRLNEFLKFLVENKFGDCEFLLGIPAQVGGAIAMNAGSSSKWIGSYLMSCEAVSIKTGDSALYHKDDIQFGNRSSSLKDCIITKATFSFPRVNLDITRANLDKYSEYRRKTQDLMRPTAGCMFANPNDSEKSAGQLIDEAGLKGFSCGDAMVSDIHANFVINKGSATFDDVVKILESVENEVQKKFGVSLQREIRIVY